MAHDDNVHWKNGYKLMKKKINRTWAFFSSGFLKSLLTTRLYPEQVLRLTSDNFTCCHTQDSHEIMTSVSASHIILTQTQPVESGWLQPGLNPGPPHQGSPALSTELTCPPDMGISSTSLNRYKTTL